MPFARFVEPGRVALVAEGALKGKLVSVVDIIDQTRALVDGPGSGVSRQQIRLNQLHLTKFRLKYPFTAPTRVVRKAWTDAKLNEKWAESQWAQKLANKEKRAQMTDYDRFKLSSARVKRNRARTAVYTSLKLKAARGGTFGKKKTPKASSKKPRTKKPATKKPAKKDYGSCTQPSSYGDPNNYLCENCKNLHHQKSIIIYKWLNYHHGLEDYLPSEKRLMEKTRNTMEISTLNREDSELYKCYSKCNIHNSKDVITQRDVSTPRKPLERAKKNQPSLGQDTQVGGQGIQNKLITTAGFCCGYLFRPHGLPSAEMINLERILSDLHITYSKQEDFFEADAQGIQLLNILSGTGFNYTMSAQSMVIEVSGIGGRTVQIQNITWSLSKE